LISFTLFDFFFFGSGFFYDCQMVEVV